MVNTEGDGETPVRPARDLNEIDMMELQAIAKVRLAIVWLEFAVKGWNSSKVKPKDLKEKFLYYKKLHDDLVRWENMARKYEGKPDQLELRLDILKNLVPLLRKGV